MTREQLKQYIKYEASRGRSSYWKRGVTEYALELCDNLSDDFRPTEVTAEALLNGASDWRAYSYGGCALIYDGDIASRLCTPSEYGKKRGGELQPNRSETWLDVQARALYQAEQLVKRGRQRWWNMAAGWSK